MSIEFFVLSGTRQGDRIPLDAALVKMGDNAACDVFFDPRLEPAVAGRAATIATDGEGWTVINSGTGKVMVNQQVVDQPTSIRSGDILRLSEGGPDLSFTISSDSPPQNAGPSPEGQPLQVDAKFEADKSSAVTLKLECPKTIRNHSAQDGSLSAAVVSATEARLKFATIVLGRDCVDSGFKSPGCEQLLLEIVRLRKAAKKK